MKTPFWPKGTFALALGLPLTGMAASADTLYVWQDSPSPGPPHTNWASAAHTIQDAVVASQPGDLVLVTNGVYATGGYAVHGTMTNRVSIPYKAITVRSVMGPEATVILGAAAPGGTNGDGAIRCAYVGYGAVLSGFTLTNGHTRFYAAVTDDRQVHGGGAYCDLGGVLTNCILAGNSASRNGGGVYRGSLYDCILVGNASAAHNGGGAHSSTLWNCTLSGNSAFNNGGGAYAGALYHCTLTNNTAADGGGMHSSTLYFCTLRGNSARDEGGGARLGRLGNCTLVGNSAGNEGGGAYGSSLYDCTLIGNSAKVGFGGGVSSGSLYNCIAYWNGAGGDHVGSDVSFSCTTSLPTNGTGNISADPCFVDGAAGNLRLQSNSPCINAGPKSYVPSDTDQDGRPRVVGGTVDMGAYEFQGEFDAWLSQYALPASGSADFSDPDGDRLNNYQEYRCGTNPTNALSVLRLLPPEPSGADVVVRWQSMPDRHYSLVCSSNLSASAVFLALATNLPGQNGMTTYTDTNAVGALPRFYRLGVR